MQQSWKNYQRNGLSLSLDKMQQWEKKTSDKLKTKNKNKKEINNENNEVKSLQEKADFQNDKEKPEEGKNLLKVIRFNKK